MFTKCLPNYRQQVEHALQQAATSKATMEQKFWDSLDLAGRHIMQQALAEVQKLRQQRQHKRQEVVADSRFHN